jgi:coenzyme F420-0:L-glutamate ligase/coenzyme F420-1:gamma-L-glutamate ligase
MDKSMPFVLTPLHNIPLVKPGDDVARLILDAMNETGLELYDNDIFVITQKIISKAEDRFINLASVVPSSEAIALALLTEKDPRFVELVLRESKVVMRSRPGTLIVEHKLGFVCANAGIDHSNVQSFGGQAEDWVLLLPSDPDGSAREIRQKLEQVSSKKIGVMIIDSHGRAWRIGTVGVAIGFSGLPGIVDLRGKPDMFGYKLRVTQVAAADELAAAASLLMGQAAENIPVVHVRGFPYALREGSFQELVRPPELDLFR